jgi:hypothetical protein
MGELSEEAKQAIQMYLNKGAEIMAKLVVKNIKEKDIPSLTVESLMIMYKEAFYAE